MNVAQSFAQYMQDNSVATLGQNLYIGEAPSSNKVSDAVWWIVASGGTPETRLPTGETVKNYLVQIFYRDRDYRTVYETAQSLEERINCDACTQLEGYETMDMQATAFPVDNDLDNEDRKVALIQATIRVYASC